MEINDLHTIRLHNGSLPGTAVRSLVLAALFLVLLPGAATAAPLRPAPRGVGEKPSFRQWVDGRVETIGEFFRDRVGPGIKEFFLKDRRIKKKEEVGSGRLVSVIGQSVEPVQSASSRRRHTCRPVLMDPGAVLPMVDVRYSIPHPGEVYLDYVKERRVVGPYINSVNPDAPARKARRMIIVGSGPDIRAFSPFGAPYSKGRAYAAVVNKYKEIFPSLRVYCMPIPTAGEFYLPEGASSWSSSQADMINEIFSALVDDVMAVDAYDALSVHVREPIYSRTDHHWMPLGAFYAAQSFAAMSRVPFRSLDSYDENVVHDFTGTMAGYTRDRRIRSTAEEFIFYTPKGLDSRTIYTVYHLDRKRRSVVSEDPPEEGDFFKHYPDGSPAAYSTFGGGDARIVEIHTGSHSNSRRLMILKDSFGNAVPSFLFYSFEQIHVIDCRYFTRNMVEYVSSHGITDILFVNNLSHVCTDATVDSYYKYLTQEGKVPQ